MSNQIYLEARKIFDKYNGSYFQMEKEGEYQKYKNFKVPQRIEATWISERKKNIVEKLYSETSENEIASLFSQYGETVSQTIDESGLSFMLKFAKENKNKWDSFTNVRIVESILNSLSRFNKNNKQAAINESLELLRNVEKTAFRVSDSYKVNGVFPDYVAESRIAERVNRNIKYWENELKSL